MVTYAELFQLAQDKGCYNYNPAFNKDGNNNKMLDDELKEIELSWVSNTKELVQQMRLMIIQKWLRDEHKRIVESSYNVDFSEYQYFIYSISARRTDIRDNGKLFPTYEQALTEGIHEALKLI